MTMNISNHSKYDSDIILVLGGTGKTGSRIVNHLSNHGRAVRIGSRFGTPSFAWDDPSNWHTVLENINTVYINFAPDLAIPGAADAIQSFVNLAIEMGVKRAVLLSGRGEEEAQKCEGIIQRDEWEWTVVRASWFAQNFSEGAFVEMVQAGVVALPAGAIKEPFVDIDDIADVAVTALTESGHHQKIYEVTGPELLTFEEAIQQISIATQRKIHYEQIPTDVFIEGAKGQGLPDEVIWLLNYLFTHVLDGRNAHLTHGVEEALGRKPTAFSEYAKRTAITGVWDNTTKGSEETKEKASEVL